MKLNFKQITLWLCRFFVSTIFIYAGISKLLNSSLYPWMVVYPKLSIFSAVTDVVVGIGLLLFPLLKYKKLSLLSAVGVVGLMTGAIILHVVRGEVSLIGINIVLLLLGVLLSYIQYVELRKGNK